MSTEKDFYVVAVGASAGGLEAVQLLFDNIPNNTGVAYVIIQHLSPNFKSLMPELLSKHTKMEIYTAEDNQEIKPNCIYLNQRTKNIGIKNNKFFLLDKAPKDHLNLPIDILFHMLGEAYKEKAIGVILSGTGSDGSRGIKTIKEAGGTIFVQEPFSAQFDGMPNSAILTNLPDFVLPPDEIADIIIQYTSKRPLIERERDLNLRDEKHFKAILGEILKYTGVNFKKYKINTLLRRLEKRMSLHNIDNLEDYYLFLKNNDKERASVSQEFLIGVTSFYRDKQAFDIIKKKVVPSICQSKNKHDVIRIWIPGCSSGEEVYSIAMLFEDHIRSNKLSYDYKIFATDIDKRALQLASMGTYTVNNCEEIEKKFLEEYFIKTGESIQIIKRIREKIVFSYHDVTKDPPFIKVDLISCRNLLIYFENSAQKSVLNSFQFALNKSGYLFLGNSESLGTISNLFKQIDNKQKIFKNINGNSRLFKDNELSDHVYSLSTRNSFYHPTHTQYATSTKKQNELSYYKYLSKKHSPVSVFIDKEFNVQFILGDFKKWFNQTDGVFTNNLLKMVSPELATVIKNGIRRVVDESKAVSISNLVYKNAETEIITDLFFEYVDTVDNSRHVYLVQFGIGVKSSTAEHIILSNEDISNISKQRIEGLEEELKIKSEELQNTIEELETSNEELQSSNEELMSSNEELQSANEELQSVNEELYTVNSEFQEKNRELENLNNDITNLLHSTDIGTLFLDLELNIRKFTPAVKRIFNLEDSDLGRSLTSFASEFDEATRGLIISEAKTALEKLGSVENEIQDKEGNWYLKKVSPFITSEKKIDGVVITFVQINQLKKKEEELSQSQIHLRKAQEISKVGSWYLDLETNEVTWTKELYRMYGFDPDLPVPPYTEHMKLFTSESWEVLSSHLDRTVKEGIPYELELKTVTKDKQNGWMWVRGEPMINEEGKVYAIWGAAQDITKRKREQLELLEAKKKAEVANVYKNQFLANMSHEIRTPMNGLVGFASMLRNKELDEETKSGFIDIVESCSNQLLNLINDIIDVSKIEVGELKIVIEDCHLNKMFNELDLTFNKLKQRRGKSNIKINSNIPDKNHDVVVRTDGARLKQVLTNLIDNSLKFTEKGSIEFGYNIVGDNIVIAVSDTGIGMSKDKLEVIFERFLRLEHKDKSTYDGTGLGLAISKGIIDLLNGTITANSEDGKGSVFTITIPYMAVNKQKEPGAKSNSYSSNVFENKRLLVAEDDYINRILIEEALKEVPLEVIWAHDGAEAVSKFKQTKDVALVLMDIRMPKLDGYEAAKEIFKFEPNAKIIAQTSYAMSSDREKCLNNGFVDYLSKPIEKEKLVGIIGKWIS